MTISSEICENILDALDHDQVVALATIIAARGSEGALQTIKPGAKLLVNADGTIIGSYGDPDLDAKVIAQCQRQLEERLEAETLTLDLLDRTLDGTQRKALDVYVELIYGQPTVLVVGGGHIGMHLARMSKLIGYRVVVLDDRPDFASYERFPDADQVIAADMAQTLSTFPIGPSTYIVLVTRGHGFDYDTLRAVLGSRAAYIGMIGSRSRVGAAFSRLLADGVPGVETRHVGSLLEKVYAPIGLRIGAQTPEEIALSILAEIVNVRRGGDAPSSKDRLKETRDV